MKRLVHLLVIDPQNDFCDLPRDYLSAVLSFGVRQGLTHHAGDERALA